MVVDSFGCKWLRQILGLQILGPSLVCGVVRSTVLGGSPPVPEWV